jgi:hypothetical protein
MLTNHQGCESPGNEGANSGALSEAILYLTDS